MPFWIPLTLALARGRGKILRRKRANRGEFKPTEAGSETGQNPKRVPRHSLARVRERARVRVVRFTTPVSEFKRLNKESPPAPQKSAMATCDPLVQLHRSGSDHVY